MEEEKGGAQSNWELVRFGIIAVLIVIPVRLFIAQPFIVSGSSMVPTFSNGDYLIVDEISYKFEKPERYDVIIFRFPTNHKKYLIKRIIGLPQESVDLKGALVTITSRGHSKGVVLDQPFIKNSSSSSGHWELGDNEYFVMGDNRPASSDSRFWGPVAHDLIVGRAFLRLLPIKHADILPGDYEQVEEMNPVRD